MHPDMVHISIQADDVVVSMEGLCHHTAQRLMLIPGKMLVELTFDDFNF